MASKTLEEKFYEKYERPSVGDLVVGFSGIDPQKKSNASGHDTSEPLNKEEINEAVRESLENLLAEIKTIDCGEL